MLDWPRAPRRETTIAARRRIWQSRDRRFRVVHSAYLYRGLADCWYALDYDPLTETWNIISRHRRRGPAFRACEKVARQKSSKPRRRKSHATPL